MAVFSRVKTWVSNEVLTASDLNAEFNNLLNNTIPASIEDYSSTVSEMQTTADPGGLGTESQATTLAGELTRIRFALKRLAGTAQWYIAPASNFGTGGIATAALADNAVSAAKIASDAVTTAKILDANVTTAKLATGAVTPAKINLGAQISSSSGGTGFTTNTTLTDVNNLSVAFTASGTKNVFIEIVPDNTDNFSYIYFTRSGETGGMDIVLLRDSTVVGKLILEESNVNAAGFTGIKIPAYAKFLDASPAAGPYTYKIQILNRVSGSTPSCGILYAKLLVYEI
jgi:hypothetical protein